MENKSVFALLIGVGNYEKLKSANLPTYNKDLSLMATSLKMGLKVPEENIRIMSGTEANGYVTTTDLAKSISEFKSLLSLEDTFIFYFSGHGLNKNIMFSDGQVELQSIIDYIESLSAKNKIIILDCCYSGDFITSGARMMNIEESLEQFVGHGIAILASSAANEVSRLCENGTCSMFTNALSSAIRRNVRVKKGKISLNDIYDETMFLVSSWNRSNPGKIQQPIFRSSLGGTIYFQVEEYEPYKPGEYSFEDESFRIVSVESLSTISVKRLRAFIILNQECEVSELSSITKKIAEQIRFLEIHSSPKTEKIFKNKSARAIWCYFGKDENDIVNSLHYAYTIWASDDEMKQLYFKTSSNSSIIDDICVYENKSYDMLKQMQLPTNSRDEFIKWNRELLSMTVNLAEKFIVDIQEVANKTKSIENIQEQYRTWISEVKKNYIKITDGDVAPDDLHIWSDEIMNLAGWVLDLSLLLENKTENGKIGEREQWLIHDTVRKYNDNLEKIKEIEAEIEF